MKIRARGGGPPVLRTRRELLALGASACASFVFASDARGAPVRLLASPPSGLDDAATTLVLVQLSGGNDGLNTVVPCADPAYHAARPTLRITDSIEIESAQAKHGARGLHPRLRGLARWYADGKVAIVEGCGYPEPNRSHFESLDIWHTADPRGRDAGDGWIGRLCAQRFATPPNPHRLVHVGSTLPYALHSARHPALCLSLPEAYRWVGDANELDVACADAGARSSRPRTSLEFLRDVQHEAQASSSAVRRAADAYVPRAEYPNEAFAAALRTAAALIHARLGCRVLSVELGGFDTHNDQRARHDQVLKRLDDGLAAFLDDLHASDELARVLVLVFSEFGRRVAENASRGTDHGTAAPLFVLGERVQGGLHGAHPSLVELERGDMRHTTDFRSVYATLLERWFGADARAILRGDYAQLPLIQV